ncbi:uncharacterized protein LOC110902080 [Helianthus annuus]|uniref:uncharacterized protein LOC110902080 n=1 Tax=Helianthus annuus TaxID=4232 RepID=UPI000B8F903A|nr:uncharacterized protein LOC110902080 [Helianthus annuus]
MNGFGFHPLMVKWVMACVSSTSFSLAINGNLYGYFKGKRGLRQGDPMSPYLFTLVMEVLTLILQRQVSISSDFRFHSRCQKQRIINLCFADDLFLFARGDNNSAKVILDSLNIFKNMSSLVPSMTKSTVFFGNVADSVKARILTIMSFDEGVLPVRYLDVPLISSRLHYKDCKKLVENMDARITNWKTKCLSFAGFRMNTKLAEVYVQGEWRWPSAWENQFAVLNSLRDLVLVSNRNDELVWRSRLGVDSDFSTALVWDDIRQSQNDVSWTKMVWFPQAIPRHSFLVWLLIHRKLKTQDIMSKWGNANFNLLCCSLCTLGPDSHGHLFFECNYANQIWIGVRDKAGMGMVQNKWDAIFDYLVGIAQSKTADHVIAKLVVNATAYFVWEERNKRLFTNK